MCKWDHAVFVLVFLHLTYLLMLSRSIHDKFEFFFMAEYYSCVCVRVHARAHHFILSSVNGHLRGFHTLAIVSNAAVKMMWWFLNITQPLSGRAAVKFKDCLAVKFMLSHHGTSVGSSLWNIGTLVPLIALLDMYMLRPSSSDSSVECAR